MKKSKDYKHIVDDEEEEHKEGPDEHFSFNK
jgi:hypothetical protein